MGIQAYLLEKDGRLMAAGSRLRLWVKRYSWAAAGGPERAEIESTGASSDLWDLANRLGCGLILINTQGDPVWWGYLSRLRLRQAAVEVSLDLEELANTVAVVYRAPGETEPRSTAWLGDAASQDRFGVKELQVILGEALEAQALAQQAAELGQRRSLAGRPARLADGAPGLQARLTGLGWWQTAGWRTYAQPLGLEQNAAPASASLRLGDDPRRQRVRQAFALGAPAGWVAGRLALRVARVGQPAGGLVARLLGPQGETLAEAVYEGREARAAGWVEAGLSPAVALSPGTSYTLELCPAQGGPDPLNYYRLGLDAGLSCPHGGLLAWDGSGWNPLSPEAQLLFKLVGTEESALQLRRILAPDCGGQFFTRLTLPEALGAAPPLWRGRLPLRTAREEAEDLLRQGTSRGRRALCRVTPDRRVEIWEAPGAGEADAGLRPDGRLLDGFGVPLPEGACPAGVWLRPLGLDPAPSGTGGPVDLGRLWVERSEYEVETGRVRLLETASGR